jgi:hypothetical protein
MVKNRSSLGSMFVGMQRGPIMIFETRGVLAGAYRGNQGDRVTLSHAVEVSAPEPPSEVGSEIRVLCGRVPLDHIADHYSASPYPEGLKETPTCKTCAARLAKLQTQISKGQDPCL